MTALVTAVDAVEAAVVRLRGRAGAADDDDERDPDAPIVRIAAEPATLAGLERFALTPVYRDFVRAHSSHDFVDAGLRCGPRDAWISAATSVAELTALHADKRGWAPHWLVCGLASDGCYVLDLDARSHDDCPVLFVPAGDGRVETVAPGFAAFLTRVARDSAGPVREHRPRDDEPTLAQPAEVDDRRAMIVPLAFALLAALLLWWLR